jgi:DNA-binding transcriptional regulator YiaG
LAPKHSSREILSIQQMLNGVIVDVQMTPKQYADAIERLGLSQRAAGAFLGVDERTSRRWVLGESAIPESAAKLLRLMVRLKITPEDVK